jgi:hypothetical protein
MGLLSVWVLAFAPCQSEHWPWGRLHPPFFTGTVTIAAFISFTFIHGFPVTVDYDLYLIILGNYLVEVISNVIPLPVKPLP